MKTHVCREDGTTLIEVIIASGILVTLMAGLMSLLGLSIATTENQGHLAARTTEYAQDKMEQLLTMSYGDALSDSTVPLVATGARAGQMELTGTGLAVGGSYNPATPVTKYVDYLDQNGHLCGSPSALDVEPASSRCLAPVGTTPPDNWFYQRVWKVELPTGTTGLKQITVTATIARGFGGGTKAVSILTVLKSSPF
jgi:hypothetical protein